MEQGAVSEDTHHVLEILHVVAQVLLGLALRVRNIQVRSKVDDCMWPEIPQHRGDSGHVEVNGAVLTALVRNCIRCPFGHCATAARG